MRLTLGSRQEGGGGEGDGAWRWQIGAANALMRRRTVQARRDTRHVCFAFRQRLFDLTVLRVDLDEVVRREFLSCVLVCDKAGLRIPLRVCVLLRGGFDILDTQVTQKFGKFTPFLEAPTK